MIENIRTRPAVSALLIGLFLSASVFVIIAARNLSTLHIAPVALPQAAVSTQDLPAPAETAIRWMMYLTASALVGGTIFGLLVWRPAYDRWDQPNPDADREATKMMRRIMLIGLVGLALATFGYGYLKTLWAVPHSPDEVSTRALLLWTRITLLAVIGLFVWRLPPAATGRRRFWWIIFGLTAVMLLTFSLQSHAASSKLVLPIVANYMHVMASSAWIGGLLPLASLLTTCARRDAEDGRTTECGRPIPLSLLIPRFSLLAITCVAALTITGLFSTSLLVRTPEALLSTGYGRALIAKIGMVGILLALGGVNLMILTPMLRRLGNEAGEWFLRTVRTELAIGLLVMAATGLIAGAVPAFRTYREAHALNLAQTVEVDGMSIALTADPQPIARDRLSIDLNHTGSGTQFVPSTVLIQIGDQSPVVAKLDADGHYTVRGRVLSLRGPWQVSVIVQSADHSDLTHTFEISDH